MTATDPRPTHLLHVVGRAIARETNIQPAPVVITAGRPAENIAEIEGIMLATVRRCLAHRPDLDMAVEWTGVAKASVWVGNGRRGEVAARFTITPITDADIARVGAPPAKELLPR